MDPGEQPAWADLVDVSEPLDPATFSRDVDAEDTDDRVWLELAPNLIRWEPS